MEDEGQALLRLSVPKLLATEASSEGVLMRRIDGKANSGALL
jgi:hypothetical protein